MIHVFHGFLGSPDDFKFLKRDDVMIHDLYEMNHYPEVTSGDTLIGYSMGGRIALEIASRRGFNLKKVVLINAHPGLETEEEKLNRTQFEKVILNELMTRSMDDFMDYWNELPIFFHDRPIRLHNQTRFQESAALFDRYRLSRQKNFLPEMIEHKDKILFIAGLFDEKYMDLVSEVLMPNHIAVKGIPGGHRLFQQENELKQILIDEGVL